MPLICCKNTTPHIENCDIIVYYVKHKVYMSMDVIVIGGNKKQRKLVESVANFMESLYFKRNRTLSIEFFLSRTIAKDCGVDGICCTFGTYKPREFEIGISGLMSESDMIKTVIHELIHVKQYVKGELIDRTHGKYKTIWKGKDHSKTSYSKQPWEKQAYRLQESLYKKYMLENR